MTRTVESNLGLERVTTSSFQTIMQPFAGIFRLISQTGGIVSSQAGFLYRLFRLG